MPIVRTYQCEECFHRMEVTLTSEQWDEPPPNCPRCTAWDFKHQMQQEFKPVAIGGSNTGKANAIVEGVLNEDFHVADIQREHRREGTPKVRYKDPSTKDSNWGTASAALLEAMANGRHARINHGTGLDVLHTNLKNGVEPDLIANSKKKAIRIY